MTLRRRNTVPPNMLLSSIASWGDGVMAPPFLPLRHYAPSQVTEDTPPDLLEGTMDLEVTLPNGQVVVMSVHRSTPMMDLLIQVTTAHRINPGGHVIQVISDNIFLTYKPSTPIGTLDTNAIKIVSKNALNEMTKARKSNLQQEAIERNIRLKPKEWVYKQQLVVNLPRNQLAVYRVPPKSLISEIFSMVCEDKNLDPETHEIRHPANVDERLRGSCSLSDYQLQEVCVVSSDFRPPPLSVTDLITMSSIAHPEDKKRRGIFGIFSRKAKSSTGDSSVSSGSAGERSVSPARSDESAEGRPSSQAQTPTSSSATLTNVYHKSNVTVSSSDRNSLNSTECSHISRPVSMISLNKTKKRPAPVPPQRVKRTTDEQKVNEKINSSQEKTNLSRHNSDSSGYHEQERKSLQTSPSCSEVGSIDANRSVLRPASNLTSVSNSSSTTSVKIGKRKAPSPPRPSVTRNGRTSPSSIPETPEGNETKQILEVCEESATNGETSHVSVTECSENLTKEKVDQRDCVKLDSCQMNISENSFNNLEHSSSQSKLQTVDKVSTTQNASTENSLSEQAAVTAAEVVVKEENHNEILQASVVEPYVEKTALESTESPVVANSSSSSSPPLVASGKGSTTNNSSTEIFAVLPLLPQSTNSVSPLETNPSKSSEAASNSETVLVTASSHPQKPLNASMPALSNAVDPKKQDSSLKFNFLDRLNNDDSMQTRQKDDISSDKNLKINTLPRSAKKKILKIIPIFSTISRFNKEKHRKSFDLNTLGKFYNNDDDNKNNDSNNAASVKTVTKNGSDIDINNTVNAEKPTSYNIIIQNSSSNNNINNNNDNNSNNNNEQINYDSNVGKVVAVESIFQVSSTYENMKTDAPVPAPRKALHNLENSMPNKIDNLSESSENSMKSLKDSNLTESHVSEKDSKVSATSLDDGQDMLSLSSEENRDFYELENENNLEEGSSLGVQNDTVTSTPHIDKGESECEFHLDRTLTSTTGKLLTDSECSSSPIQDSSSSLCSDSENEAKTRTVGLSSETSCTSIEMMNPKDIQRPKRHRRKKIPEVFMKNSASISSNVSNDSPHIVGNDHVDSVSTSLQPPKNFENVHKEVEEETIGPISTERECNDGFEEMDPRSNAQSDLKIVNERFKEVPKNSHSDCNNKNAQLSVIYIEDLNGEESTTDPLTPPIPKKKKFTTKLQLSTGEQVSSVSKEENNNVGLQSLSTTEVNMKTINENNNCNSKFSKSCKEDVLAELKSTIENPDINSDHRPIILNLKQKENRDWDIGKPSEYNIILDVNKKNGGDCNASDNTFVRSASASSYESFDTNSLKKSSPSTETSYESVPPPLPDSRIPQASDCDSKTSSVLSRQSSFSDNDSVEFTKPNAPAFSISTYESRASKLSYNKKLSRSGSLASFKDIQTTEFSPSDDRKLNRSDSQRNEVFRSDNLKKKCTSTTFLNLTSNKDDDDERISFSSNIRPSLIKSRSRASLLENGSDIDDMSRTIQFDVSSSKEPITFTRPLPFKTYNNLRKAKSQLDISNDNRMAEGYQGIPDSGLANEYMRLQDDFVKWQQQLLQNQQLLHNRVAPIAANPPVLNSTGRHGGGLRLGWKAPTPWLVNNMLNQSTPAVPQQQQQQQRKPIEITIPIRLVDSDEEDADKTPQPKFVPNQAPQRNTQVNDPSSSRRNGPNVSIDSWQERPSPSFVVITQPTVIEPTAPRPFANQPRMQTVFQSTPNEWQGRDTVLEKPQAPQQRQQNTIVHPPQNVSRPEFYQGQRQEDNVTYPQPNISRPEFYKPNQPKPNFIQEPPSQFRQMPPPHTKFQEIPQQNHFRNENSQEQLQNFEPHQPIYNQTQVFNSNSVPESNGKKFSEQNPPFATRSYPQNFNRPQQAVSPPVVDKNGDGINARFSSVVTLSNDKNDQNVPQKDKVRSVVQLNNTSPQIGQSPAPFLSKIINAASNKDVNNRECEGPISFQPSDTSSVAPMSTRLVQQAVQQPYGGCRVSPPKVEQRYSPPKFEQRFSPPKIEQHYQTPTIERQPSPSNLEPSLPFGEVKLRHVESPRVSPPKISAPEPLVAPPPPPPPPPSKANGGPSAPPPPPPPPAMSEADRRAATGKKILGAAYTPQLDAREELMMAIRQFGGSHNLRKSAHPVPH
ncbi:UNVERIFIED_CONTAM: hypothetical protein RMT77_016286 [Armadillidium vulgare]